MNYLLLPNQKEIKKYKAYGFNFFILPLKDYSIGFDVYYDVNEINKLSEENNIYIMINKFIHSNELENIKNIINNINLSNIKGIFIEDLSLISFLPKEKVILYQSHMINNYKSINYFKDLGISNIVITNELTIDEIKEIRENTKSKLYYFFISKNILMYSRRTLVSNYLSHYNLSGNNKYIIKEKISKKELIIKEEDKSTTISNNDLFVGNKYIEDFNNIDYLIINLTNIDEKDEDIVLNNYDKKELINLISNNYYFLENKIPYKVGDIK